MNTRQLFQKVLAQTSPAPQDLHIASAKGVYLTDVHGKQYIDLIGGISVANVGHGHRKVVEAVKNQAEKYMHVMVYGELMQTPQIAFAEKLVSRLPASLNAVYFTNSGAEACEAAIKLAKRATGRSKMIAAQNSYHGHTNGALSLMGSEFWRNAYRPLLPDVHHFPYGSTAFIEAIDEKTACVFVEIVQAESGVRPGETAWFLQLRARCIEKGALLVVDEIQTGFGRTGKLWAFEHVGIVPDMLLLGKALGGGMPMGALVADKQLMDLFSHNPVLGHMTTFGGHPVCCAAGLAAFEVLLEEELTKRAQQHEAIWQQLSEHKQVRAFRAKGAMMAMQVEDNKTVLRLLELFLQEGLFSDWFLFADDCIRLAPPLIMTEAEVLLAVQKIKRCLDRL